VISDRILDCTILKKEKEHNDKRKIHAKNDKMECSNSSRHPQIDVYGGRAQVF